MVGDNVSEDLYDYDEPRGRFQIILHRARWRWILATIMTLAFAIPFVIAHIVAPNSPAHLLMPPSHTLQQQQLQQTTLTSSSLLLKSSREKNSKSPIVGGKSNISKTSAKVNRNMGGEYNVNGGTSSSLSNFTDFEGLVSSCSLSTDGSNNNTTLLTSVYLSNVYLDAAQFSSSLENCLELESVSLENVWLIGNFTRVHLPKLNKFLYVQNENDKRDSYKSPETLQQTLFFDKSQLTPSRLPTWNVEQDLLNLDVDIAICKGGTRLIDIKRQTGEIYLNVKYCEPVLLNAKGSYDSLTLINCNVTEASIPVIPSTLKYLNVRNAVQRTPHLAELLRKLTQLEELYIWLTFHCDWPGYELFLNLNDLPQTIKTVGINNVDTTYLPGEGASTSIRTLTVGDYTTNTTVSQGFPTLLPNLERLNVVNMSDPTPAAGYSIIHTAIQMKVKEIAVVNLHRNYSVFIVNEEKMLDVEGVLDHAGIPKEPLSCFLLRLQENSTTYTGRKLSTEEQHQIRFIGLGFNKLDSMEDYIKWDSL